MQRPRREERESAARTRSQPTLTLIDVIILTTDPALLATLREAAGPSHQLLHAQSADAAVELLVGGRHGILIIDVEVIGTSDVASLIEQLQAQFPEVLLLATGRRDEQNAVAGHVSTGRIYRFLHKPVSPARAELFISAATRRYSELHPQGSRATFSARTLRRAPPLNVVLLGAAVALIATGGWLWSQRQVRPAQQSVATSDSSAPGASPDRSPQERPPVAAPAPTPVQNPATALLAQASAARAAGRLAPPAQDNAFDSYRAALRADPANETARTAIRDITTTIERQVAASLAAGDTRAAQRDIESLRAIAPQHARLESLQRQLADLAAPRKPAPPSAATRTPAPDRSPSAAGVHGGFPLVTGAQEGPPAAPTVTRPAPSVAQPRNSNVQLAKAFLAANQLVEPEDASALSQLRRAKIAREDASAIQITATDLGTRLLNRALAAIKAEDVDRARSAYDDAVTVDREFETSLPDLELVAIRIRELQGAKKSAALHDRLARVSKLRSSGQLTEPAGENAYELLQPLIKEAPDSPEVTAERQHVSFALLERTRTALAAGNVDQADVLATRAEETLPGLPQTKVLRQQVGEARQRRDDASALVQAASLKRRRETPAIYPRDALLRQIEGWVDLEFTITAEGVPESLVVKSATPPRVFDNAALIALRQWRFEPIVRDGAPRAQRATLRMEFKLQD